MGLRDLDLPEDEAQVVGVDKEPVADRGLLHLRVNGDLEYRTTERRQDHSDQGQDRQRLRTRATPACKRLLHSHDFLPSMVCTAAVDTRRAALTRVGHRTAFLSWLTRTNRYRPAVAAAASKPVGQATWTRTTSARTEAHLQRRGPSEDEPMRALVRPVAPKHAGAVRTCARRPDGAQA